MCLDGNNVIVSALDSGIDTAHNDPFTSMVENTAHR